MEIDKTNWQQALAGSTFWCAWHTLCNVCLYSLQAYMYIIREQLICVNNDHVAREEARLE